MRKTLVPLVASLALCGAATTAMVISTAHAQPAPHNTPVMLAQADNAPAGPPERRGLRQQQAPGEMAARMKQMCQEGIARQTGDLAYLETRLNLTQSEQSLFQGWKDAKLGIERRHADQCAQRASDRVAQRQNNQGQNNQAQNNNQARPQRPGRADRSDPADRMAREEDRLKERLADISAERPALQAFYAALSPEQKRELDRAGMRDGHGPEGGMMRHSRFAQEMGPRGPMGGPMGERGPGMMDRPPMPPDGPDGPPPVR